MTAPPRALVTGATGYLGSRLVRRLVADGWVVHAVARPASTLRALEPVLGAVCVHRYDAGAPAQTPLPEIAREAAPDVLFHLAAVASASHRHEDVAPMLAANVAFPALLVDAAVGCGLRSVVNTGTAWTHFAGRDYEPVCLYAATKKAFEDLLAFYTAAAGLSAVTLELFDVYGPGDARPKLLNLLRDASRGTVPLDLTPGRQRIDLLYVDDAVEAYLAAARRLLAGEVQGLETYAAGTGRTVTIREVAEAYTRVTGRAVPVRWGGRPYREREVMEPWSRGKALPGWRAAVDLEEGIRRIEAAERSGA